MTLSAPGVIFVRGHGIDAVLRGDLHAGGTAAAPRIDGGFQMIHGTFSVAGPTLTFTTGTVTFDGSGRLGAECWKHYRQKLARWHDSRPAVTAFFAGWPANRDARGALVLDSKTIAACLHRARAPMRAADLDPAPSRELLRWAVANCQFMRERFTIADLLTFAGWWDDAGVARVLDRVEGACAAAEADGA